MRNIKSLLGQQEAFNATFVRQGSNNTILLRRVYNSEGKFLCDHAWITYRSNKTFTSGEAVTFHATVDMYVKGLYVDKRKKTFSKENLSLDYGFFNVTTIDKYK